MHLQMFLLNFWIFAVFFDNRLLNPCPLKAKEEVPDNFPLSCKQWVHFHFLPVQKKFQHCPGRSKGPVCCKEDADVGKISIPKSCEQVLHQFLQSSSFDSPDLGCFILSDSVLWGQLVSFTLKKGNKVQKSGRRWIPNTD